MWKKFGQRAAALGLSAALMLTMSAAAFQDVAEDSDFAGAVSVLAEKGVTKGVNADSFNPDAILTTAQLVTFLGRIDGAQIDPSASAEGITADGWSSGYMLWAIENGLVKDGSSQYTPLDAGQTNKILAAYCQKKGVAAVEVTAAGESVTRGEAAVALAALSSRSADAVRLTAYGTVQGYVDEAKKALVWKSVPYGQAERWAAPTAPQAWDGILDCTAAGEKAIQTGDPVVGTEDCLKLDIYAPENAENLPVLFFIHGGNNQTGSADAELKGETLANKANCIFVSVDFRLGALGFNPLPALRTGDPLEDSGNYTLLDIAQALDWVAENIEAFGGDGSNITISGFSAGGRDVMATLISPIFKGKYQQAISFSGGMTVSDVEDGVKVFARGFAPLAVEDGRKATEEEAYAWLQTDGEDVREWLMGLSGERIAAVFGNAGIRMAKFPHLFTDGTVLPKEGFDTEEYADVPVMMITGTGEFSLFGGFSTRGAERDFTLKYGGQLYEWSNAEASAVKMNAKGYAGSMYSLAIDFGTDSDLNAIPGVGQMGAYHGVFVNLIDQYSTNYGWAGEFYKTPAALELSDALCAYIGSFIRTGDPNSEANEVSWTPWAAEGNNALIFGTDTDKADIRMVERRISYDDVIAEIEADTTISAERKEYLLQNELNGRWFSARLDEHFNTPSLWEKE